MKKKTLKGLVTALAISGVVATGVSAISILTKGFTDFEKVKIQPKGEVVERFVWDEDEGGFVNQHVQKLDEGTETLETILFKNEYNIKTLSNLSPVANNLSLSEKEELIREIKFKSNTYYGFTIDLIPMYPSSSNTYWGYSEESKQGVAISGPSGSSIATYNSTEYDYFDTIRINFSGIENEMIAVHPDVIDEDGKEQTGVSKVRKSGGLMESYVDLKFIGGNSYEDLALYVKADTYFQKEPITISSIELVRTNSDIEEDATTYLNWAVLNA